jgi:hypothetical protein
MSVVTVKMNVTVVSAPGINPVPHEIVIVFPGIPQKDVEFLKTPSKVILGGCVVPWF